MLTHLGHMSYDLRKAFLALHLPTIRWYYASFPGEFTADLRLLRQHCEEDFLRWMSGNPPAQEHHLEKLKCYWYNTGEKFTVSPAPSVSPVTTPSAEQSQQRILPAFFHAMKIITNHFLPSPVCYTERELFPKEEVYATTSLRATPPSYGDSSGRNLSNEDPPWSSGGW